MRAIFIFLTLIFASTRGASATEKFDSGIKFILEEEAPKSEKHDDSSRNVWDTSAWAGAVFSSYSLTSVSGNSINLPLTMGSGFGGGFSIGAKDGTRAEINVEKVKVEYPIIAGITTAPLEVLDYDAKIGISIPSGSLRFRPGYRLHFRDMRETGPSAVMTSSVQHGPSFFSDYFQDIGRSWMASVSVGIFAPIFLEEKFQSSGASNLRLGANLNGLIAYQVSTRLSFGIAPKVAFFMSTFKGTGARAISNVNEKWFSFVIPLEVSYEF